MTIELYTWDTPNGRKISIGLEEMGLPYTVHPVNLGKKEQHAPEFLKISPSNKIPAIVDTDNGISVFESGAILMYLADKAGKFYQQDLVQRIKVNEWLMWQMGNFGPMLGRAHAYLYYHPGRAPYAEEWFAAEAKRLYRVLDTRLETNQFMAGDYSIADIATFPWAARHPRQRVDLNDYPNVKRWYLEIAARPAVKKGYMVPASEPIRMPK